MQTIDWLLWLPLGMDLLLAIMTYPLFFAKGLPWFLGEIGAGDDGGETAKKNDNAPISEEKLANNHRVQSIWEVLMVAYTGYVALIFLAAYETFQHPETFATPTSWAMFALMLAKIACTQSLKGKVTLDKKKSQQKGKENTLYFFYLPTYGGYAILTTFFSW